MNLINCQLHIIPHQAIIVFIGKINTEIKNLVKNEIVIRIKLYAIIGFQGGTAGYAARGRTKGSH